MKKNKSGQLSPYLNTFFSSKNWLCCADLYGLVVYGSIQSKVCFKPYTNQRNQVTPNKETIHQSKKPIVSKEG